MVICTEYTIENPVEGKNTITTRTVDLWERVSEENKVEITYQEVDDTLANMKLLSTGATIMIVAALVILVINLSFGICKYNKLKGVK